MNNEYMGLDGFVWFTGVVEDRNDPDKLGRVRVRCLGYHTEDINLIPTKDLPWAHVMHPVTDPSMQGMGQTPSFLVEGTWVVGFFMDAKQKQQPMIMGTLPGVPQESGESKTFGGAQADGFSDPNGKYPQNPNNLSGHDIKESDTNRLAKNDEGQQHKVLETKDTEFDEGTSPKGITKGVTNSVGDEWGELTTNELTLKLSSRFNATYPKNHVFESESGHIKEFDDTENSERIHEYHTSGTFYEVDADGTKSIRVVGDKFEVVVGTEYVNVKGSVNLTVEGDVNTYVQGNMTTIVDGDKTEVVRGNLKHEVHGAVEEVFGSTQRTDVTGKVTEVYGQSIATEVTGRYDIDVKKTGDEEDVNGEFDVESETINLNKTAPEVQSPNTIIADPTAEVKSLLPASDIKAGFANNYTTANDLRTQQDEQKESSDSFKDIILAEERYIGSWNNYDSEYQLDNPRNLEYITQNNIDVAYLREQSGDNWTEDDYWKFKTKRKFTFFRLDSHMDGAFVEGEYTSTLWDWNTDVDKRIRPDLGKVIDDLASQWSTQYPELPRLIVTSGYRSIRRNAGTQGSPRHRTGKACDIYFGNYTIKQRQDFLQLCIDVGFLGIGTYLQNPKKGRFHLDILYESEWRQGGGEQYTYLRNIFNKAGYNVPSYPETNTSY